MTAVTGLANGSFALDASSASVWTPPVVLAMSEAAATNRQIEFERVLQLIARAKQGALFLMFMPRQSPLLDALLDHVKQNNIYVRGVVSTITPSNEGDITAVGGQVVKSGAPPQAFHDDVELPAGISIWSSSAVTKSLRKRTRSTLTELTTTTPGARSSQTEAIQIRSTGHSTGGCLAARAQELDFWMNDPISAQTTRLTVARGSPPKGTVDRGKPQSRRVADSLKKKSLAAARAKTRPGRATRPAKGKRKAPRHQ